VPTFPENMELLRNSGDPDLSTHGLMLLAMVVEPEVLYHYTDAGGFAAIVQQGLLRATDIRFLNDPLELRYAWEALLAALETAKAEKPDYSEAYDAALQAISMTNAIDPDAIEDRIFSTSFSADGDELGQWRSYAVDAKGMALGFDKESVTMLEVPYFHHKQSIARCIEVSEVAPSSYQECSMRTTFNTFRSRLARQVFTLYKGFSPRS
jgi:hypothetical protein